MALQNRVPPWSELIATPERGMFMGNRGCLHDAQRQIVRPFRGKRWIICHLEFKGRHRQLMTPGQYTELFFLDEAAALAAGHRPCAECQRDRFNAFRDAFAAGNDLSGRVSADDIDRLLHAQRCSSGSPTQIDALPDGVMVEHDGAAFLVTAAAWRRWSPAGYGETVPWPQGAPVRVLTPAATVAALSAGYVPVLHESADRHVAGPPT
jgi:hypothetical protein